MNRLQKWTVGICSSVTETLGELENHESVTAAALGDLRRNLARARAHAQRLRRHHSGLVQGEKEAYADAKRWRKRAQLEEAEGPAIECLRRARAAQARAESLKQRAEQERTLVEEIEARVKKEEARFIDLQSKHRLLQAKQSAARATSACRTSLGEDYQVQDAFERWEVKIAEQEYQPEDLETESHDAFADDYAKSEEHEALAKEWHQLKATTNDDATDDEEGAA